VPSHVDTASSATGLRGRHLGARLAVVAVATTAAYRYTLSTLLAGLSLDSPLAYLGLVPVLSLALAVVVLRRPNDDHDIHDRQVDLLVGLPLIGIALLLMLVLPQRLDSEFWLWRLDVLSLPLFAAGLVAVLMGTRMMWRLRAPLAFLLVAWPVPWSRLLERLDPALLSSTTSALRGLTSLLPVAQPYGSGGDGGMFEVTTQQGSFVVTVASACAGASSTLGFLLLGSAALLVARGSRRGKFLWLGTGLIVAWTANLVRIVVLLAVGHWRGQHVAIDVVHPVLGTALFAATSVLMVLLLPRFGLTLRPPDVLARPSRAKTGLLASRPATRGALVLGLVVATVATGQANGALAKNEQIAGPLGQARVPAFSASPAGLRGWHIGDAGEYQQAARYFGAGATWHRLLYHSSQVVPGTQLGGLPVSVDAVDTGSRRALKAFSVQACYAFHRFEVSSHRKVDLVPGLRGELFTYYNRRDHRDWTTLAWEWPVLRGGTSGFERVVLIIVDVKGVPVPGLDGRPVAGSEHERTPVRLAAQRDFLASFAQRLVGRALQTTAAGSTGA
jgi:exosortase